MISQTTSPFNVDSNSVALDADNVQPESSLCREPFCFITNTVSTSFFIDTGANRVIVKDAKLLHGFQACSGGVKGVVGNHVSILGKVLCRVNLRADDDLSESIEMHDAVYMPTSPFNILFPQLLVSNLKKKNYKVEWFNHDDRRYVLQYSASGNEKKLTITIYDCNMFTLWTQFGYDSFTCRPCDNAAVWNGFSGSNLIPDDYSLPSLIPNLNPRDPVMEQTRGPKIDKEQRERNAEINKNLSEPTTITFNDDDFAPEPASPI